MTLYYARAGGSFSVCAAAAGPLYVCVIAVCVCSGDYLCQCDDCLCQCADGFLSVLMVPSQSVLNVLCFVCSGGYLCQ